MCCIAVLLHLLPLLQIFFPLLKFHNRVPHRRNHFPTHPHCLRPPLTEPLLRCACVFPPITHPEFLGIGLLNSYSYPSVPGSLLCPHKCLLQVKLHVLLTTLPPPLTEPLLRCACVFPPITHPEFLGIGLLNSYSYPSVPGSLLCPHKCLLQVKLHVLLTTLFPSLFPSNCSCLFGVVVFPPQAALSFRKVQR